MSARLLVLFTNNPTYGVSVRRAQEKTALKRASRKHKHKDKNKHKDPFTLAFLGYSFFFNQVL